MFWECVVKRLLALLSLSLLVFAACGSDDGSSAQDDRAAAGDAESGETFCDLWDELVDLRDSSKPSSEEEADEYAKKGADITERMKGVVDADGEDAVAEANLFFVEAEDPDAGDMDLLTDYAEETCDAESAGDSKAAGDTDAGDTDDGVTTTQAEDADEPVDGDSKTDEATTDEKLEELRAQCEESGLDNCDEIVESVTSSSDGPQAYGDDEELDALWDECEEGNWKSCDELFMDSALGSEYEAFAASCGDRLETEDFCVAIADELEDVEPDTTKSDADEPNDYGDDDALDKLWDACADEEWESCDQLFQDSPMDSAYEAFGASCGERIETEQDCATAME